MMNGNMEHIPTRIFPDAGAMSREVAQRVASLIREKSNRGETTVLGLPTGSTPLGVYRELIRLHREEDLDFSTVATFNLDEYFPMEPGSIHSYHRFMRENFFDEVNVPESGIHMLRGDIPREDITEACEAYEASICEAGGIDFQILGIGRSGHIGFNEPGSARDSRTRLVFLDTLTRADAAPNFFGEENVPPEAITMGVATILEAREVALIATSEHKAEVVRQAVEGPINTDIAATYLQDCPAATVYLDEAAGAALTRIATPWLVGGVDWTSRREIEAVTWLSQTVGKAILRLSTADYRDNHLSSLLNRFGSADSSNGEIFSQLISKIRVPSTLPAQRKMIVFSPHPDDDVISMGGTLRKLVDNGNDITVAYQTSGNIAVFDHEVRRYLDFLERASATLDTIPGIPTAAASALRLAMEGQCSKDMDHEEILELKRVIRETEAVSALEAVGLGPDNARFLNLPFYQTGKAKKDPIGQADVDIVLALLDEIQPDLVFSAGDLSDPHGTHRMCLDVVHKSLAAYEGASPEMWLYRGAWQEWSLSEASILVPMSAAELRKKILTIFKHQSQKDVAPFPGPDPREFWQRVEDRNRNTAELMDHLGLPTYYAVETFLVDSTDH
ncbi:MAG: 6-phosphogluconolactonase [Gemmatimonadota bacterium]|nr:6-phosphogluconolactonase [Gemmatimonadota bacterium]